MAQTGLFPLFGLFSRVEGRTARRINAPLRGGGIYGLTKAIIADRRLEGVRDEHKFPTVRFRKCVACGNVYAGSLTGDDACPKCHAPFRSEAPLPAGISRSAIGSHLAFSIRGSIRSLGQLEDLRSQIEVALAESPESIAFSFEDSSYLNSSLINILVKTMQSLSIRGRPTFIVTRDEDTLESMKIMDLDRVLRILPDQETYRAALG